MGKSTRTDVVTISESAPDTSNCGFETMSAVSSELKSLNVLYVKYPLTETIAIDRSKTLIYEV